MRALTRTTVLLWIILFFAVGPLRAFEHPALSHLDSYIEKAMRDWNVPGAAVAVVKDDSIVFVRGYGVRELGKPDAIDERTLFAVASNTKAMTAAALGILVDEGRLNWDDPVVKHLPSFHMFEPWVTREITIRDLLVHRSGLGTFGGDHLWIGQSVGREEITRRLRYLKPIASFRSRFLYQNLMYHTAGQVIEAVTDTSWDEFIRVRLFTPLGMHRSNTSVLALQGIANVAAPHEFVDGKLQPVEYDNVDDVAAAAAVNSSVLEMAQWVRMQLGGGSFEGKQILTPSTVREMHQAQIALTVSETRERLDGTKFSAYGLGWGLRYANGYKEVSHSGGLTGMISLVTMVPDANIGVIVLTNMAMNRLPWIITRRILDAYLGLPERDWNAEHLALRAKQDEDAANAEKKLQDERIRKTKPSLPLHSYAGMYHDNFSGNAQIALEKGKLVFFYNPRHTGVLEHWHYDTFRVTWINPIFDMPKKAFVHFRIDASGKVSELKTNFYEDPIIFTRTN